MVRTELPIDVLPAWLALNDVCFFDVKIAETDGKGYGLLAERPLTTAENTYDVPSLLSVPHELVLNAEAVEEYAKEDRNFRLLLDAVGHQVLRSSSNTTMAIHRANFEIVITWGYCVISTSTAGPVLENGEEPRWRVEPMDGICQVPAELCPSSNAMDG